LTQSLWLDGEWVSSLPQLSPGCYTTGRYTAGWLRHGPALAARLVRDATQMDLGAIDAESCLEAMRRVGEKLFGAGGGIVRVDAARDDPGRLRLLGRGRPLGPEEQSWAVVTHHELHPNTAGGRGIKLTRDPVMVRARSYAQRMGAEEALLAGPGNTWVEGGGTNLWVRDDEGRFLTPPLASGAVQGVAREILLTRDAMAIEGEISDRLLRSAREVVMSSAVRGAVAVLRIDGRSVGAGEIGPGAERLAALLDAAA
jgi:branched-subunit amino acid aminotransferase/4-amino-4-deoxychorismate lyase